MEKHLMKTNRYAFVVLNKQLRVKLKKMKKKLGKCKQITSTREGNSYLAGSEKINIQTKYEKRN